MKRLLLLSSVLILSLAMSCQRKTGSEKSGAKETTSIEQTDKVVKHGGPEQTKIDSLKAVKNKKKKSGQ